MNTNKILTDAGYRGRHDYPAIAKYAAVLNGLTEAELLKSVSEKFGKVESKLTMREHTLPFSI